MDAPLQASRGPPQGQKQNHNGGGGANGKKYDNRRRGHHGRRNNNNNNNNNNKQQTRHRSRSRDGRNSNSDNNNVNNNANNNNNNNNNPTTEQTKKQPFDENLPPNVQKDPRGDKKERLTHKATKRGNGRNTDSFDPESTLVRPDLRIRVGLDDGAGPLKHDDVVIVPRLFGPTDDWTNYYQLLQEITDIQERQRDDQQEQQPDSHKKNHPNGKKKKTAAADWIPWHEGAHLIVKQPEESPTFQKIITQLCEHFDIDRSSAGYRFNWYKDSSDWKPFHHDSAAFNPQRAKNQNITVGVSFGATRELAFLRAKDEATGGNNNHHHGKNDNKHYDPQGRCRIYFPQTNNGVFTFGRDVNIHWKHGINALEESKQDGKGRISIVLWGKARNVIEEEGSPPMLGSDGQGPHAQKPHHHHHHHRHNNNNNHRRNNHHHGKQQKGSEKSEANSRAEALV